MTKFKRTRRYARKAFRSIKSYARKDKLNPVETIVGSAAYGAVRPYAANMIPDIPQLGSYSDNIILGGVGALAAWKGKGIIKKVGMIVLANESFIAGSKAMSGLNTGSSTNSNSSGWV